MSVRLEFPLLQRFLQANRRLSARLDRRRDAILYARYDDDVAQALALLPPGSVVADVGGGRTCSFADRIPEGRHIKVLAVDVSPSELAANTTANDTLVADISHHIPLADGQVDLLVSRTVLEHVPDLEGAVNEMARVLKPGGHSFHLLPCRYALFAIIARAVPFALAKRVLHTLIPESRGVVEFDVIYDRTHPQGLERVFTRAGFGEVEVECTWDQAAYFHALFPLFLLVLLYQRVAEVCRLRLLASYALVRAVR